MNAPAPLAQIFAPRDPSSLPEPIAQPYLLVLFGVKFYVDAKGRRWIDALWAKDLVEHTRYIKNLTLAAPLVRTPAPANALAFDQIVELHGLRCIDLPAPRNIVTAFLLLPRTIAVLWRALGRTAFVHTGVAGWPLAEAWILVPLLMLRRRMLYVNVESAFWRLVPGERPSLRRRVRAVVSEKLNRVCLERCDISTFTHDGYRRSLLQRRTERGYVVEASWIDESNLLDAPQLTAVVERRRRHTGALKLVFAGRLTREKGLLVLLEAVTASLAADVPVVLDIFGEGPLADDCAAAIRALGPDAAVRMRGTMPYDHRFFAVMREYDVLVVPTISDEQPRIVFDAYAQGLPVIASRTDGLVQCVDDNLTGFLVAAGEVPALQSCITRLAQRPQVLAEMSTACVARARRLTHQQMHRTRWQLLVDRFPLLTHAA